MGAGLCKAFAAARGVFIGQLWQDNDPRCKTVRTLRVEEFYVEVLHGNEVRARCTVMGTGRKLSVAVRRFKPTSNGYKHVGQSQEFLAREETL
jgi:hypothetical protein